MRLLLTFLSSALVITGCATEPIASSETPATVRARDDYVTGSRLVRRSNLPPEVQVWEVTGSDRIEIAPVWIRPPGK